MRPQNGNSSAKRSESHGATDGKMFFDGEGPHLPRLRSDPARVGTTSPPTSVGRSRNNLRITACSLIPAMWAEGSACRLRPEWRTDAVASSIIPPGGPENADTCLQAHASGRPAKECGDFRHRRLYGGKSAAYSLTPYRHRRKWPRCDEARYRPEKSIGSASMREKSDGAAEGRYWRSTMLKFGKTMGRTLSRLRHI